MLVFLIATRILNETRNIRICSPSAGGEVIKRCKICDTLGSKLLLEAALLVGSRQNNFSICIELERNSYAAHTVATAKKEY